MCFSTPEALVRLEAPSAAGDPARILPLGQLYLKGCHDLHCNLILDSKEVAQIPVVSFGPEMTACGCIDELDQDPYPLPGPLNTPFQHIPHPQLFGHGLDLHGLALVGKGGVPGNDKEPRDHGEAGDDLVGHPVTEKFLLRVSAHIVKGQHSDGRFIRQRKGHFLHRSRFRGRRTEVEMPDSNGRSDNQNNRYGYKHITPCPPDSPFRFKNPVGSSAWKRQNAIGPHRLVDILYLLLAQKLILKSDLVLYGIIDRP